MLESFLMNFVSNGSCVMCGKGVQHANLVSHAKNRVKILRRPNLHSYKMPINGDKVRVMLCTKCKRTVRKNEVPGAQPKAATK